MTEYLVRFFVCLLVCGWAGYGLGSDDKMMDICNGILLSVFTILATLCILVLGGHIEGWVR